MKKLALFAITAIFLAGCTPTQPTPTTTPEPAMDYQNDAGTPPEDAMMQKESGLPTSDGTVPVMTFALAEQSNSGQSGTAVIEEQAGKTIVTVTISGAMSAVPQPAHIHTGSCPTPGAVKYELTAVEDGTSVTEIPATVAELKALGALALNVHKSAAESKVYTSCGNLK